MNSPENSEEQRHLRTLARRIHEGNCVLLLGPGASTDRNGAPEIPLHQRLAKELASSLSREQKKDLNPEDLRHVAQVWFEKNKNLTGLQDQVVDFYRQFSGQTTDFHRMLAALPFRFCVTTTPDDFLFNALVEAQKEPSRDWYNFRRQRTVRVADPSVHQPLVYHLYGHPHDPGSLVITENDLIDFLTCVIRKDPHLSQTLTAEICRSDSTCLFMDLGFKNWYLRVLMRSLDLQSHHEISLALESQEFFAQSKQHQTTVYFSSSRTIEFRQYSLQEFALRLRGTYSEWMKTTGQPQAPEPAPGAPRVFLSYANEDRELVESLERKLRTGGLAVWRDKQNLKAGDDWALHLKQVIGKEVDYVVVVQTPTMKARLEGEFNREIRQALSRQEAMSRCNFLLPVHTSEQDIKPELAHLHSIAITNDEGVRRLIEDVFDDWKTRPAASPNPGALAMAI